MESVKALFQVRLLPLYTVAKNIYAKGTFKSMTSDLRAPLCRFCYAEAYHRHAPANSKIPQACDNLRHAPLKPHSYAHAEVQKAEVPQMAAAIRELNKRDADMIPIIYVVVHKMHHMRFFPTDRNMDRSGNCLPGALSSGHLDCSQKPACPHNAGCLGQPSRSMAPAALRMLVSADKPCVCSYLDNA